MAKPAGNRQAKQTKPKCGAGQSCGFTCIAAHKTCTEKLDDAISKAAVEALRSHATAALATVASESTDFRGRSFDEVQNKFSANDAKHTIASTVVDHGEGITTQKVTLVAADGSGDTLTHTLLRMAAVPASEGVEAQPERIFTLADGAAKEYTDAAKHNYWDESRDSAIRAAISLPADTKSESGNSVQPYETVKILGEGGWGEAVLTNRGTVVKTSVWDRVNNFAKEAELQSVAAEAGVAPKVIAHSDTALEQEYVKGRTFDEIMDSRDSSDLTEAKALLTEAVFKLHNAGIVHNDLHQSNVMLDDSGSVKIIDYGLATRAGKPGANTRAFEFATRADRNQLGGRAAEVMSSIKGELADHENAVLGFAGMWSGTDKAVFAEAQKNLADARGKLEAKYMAAIKPSGQAEPASPAPASYPKPLPYDYSDYDIDLYSKKKAVALDMLKESFVHMFPDLVDKADDYLTAELLRLKQDKVAQRGEIEDLAVENKAADKVAAVEDKLYNRQPTGKTAAEYNTELLAKAKTFALEQGFDNSDLSEREQNVLAAHDFSHPVAHMIFGGNSTDIHQQMGSIMTSDGRPSFSAEESLASAVESLSRGYSLPRAVATAVSQAQRLSITYQDKEPARDYFWSQEFSDHVAGFVSAMVRHPDFKQISQAVRPHNIESGIRA